MIPYRDTIPCIHPPWVTSSLIVVNFAVFLVCLPLDERVISHIQNLFGLVPARYYFPRWAEAVGYGPFDPAPFITSMFLHGSALHLITNMWMLWIFGDNVEDRMGAVRFLSFYLACGLAASACQIYANPTATAPIIGASGALAGVMGAYFFLYPYARIVVWVLFMPIFIQVPAVSFLGAWVIFQLYKATSGLVFHTEPTDVAWWGHLGGILFGMASYRWFLSRLRKTGGGITSSPKSPRDL